ncbi:MAG: hypothetical protein ACE5HP_01760 [Gemmatimonadota bacterium]
MTKGIRKIRADGDTWVVRLGERPPSPDRQVVLFFCRSTDQRPYRVVEVERGDLPDEAALNRLSRRELEILFEGSRSMDFPRSFPGETSAAE